MAQDSKPTPPPPLPAGKMECFEGVRGLASLAVLIGHLIVAFWPILYSLRHPAHANYPRPVRWLVNSPARVMFDGQFAVALFFLLSGFVLSLSFFRSRSMDSLSSAAVRRYFRLMIPASASILIAYAICSAGLMYNHACAAQMNQTLGFEHQWLAFFYKFDFTFSRVARECTWDTMFGHTALYNQNLWTMSVEYTGSFLVYGFLALFGAARNRSICYLVLAAALFFMGKFYMLEFLLGVMLSDLYAANQRRPRPFWIPAPIAIGLALGAAYLVAHKDAAKVLEWTVWVVKVDPHKCFEAAAGVALVSTVAFSDRLQRFFELRPFKFLGKISFALYLVHLILICSLASGVYLLLNPTLGLRHNWAALGASAACISVSIFAAWLLYLYVDRPAITIGKRVYELVFKPRPAVDAPRPVALPAIARAA